ncbi:hypothetical protein, partial [Janthinobacterium sp.]|uniref:hypothetical protein n=1 Tax=Janthinobacterium sp. TaxID=1871054 RepID=UPI00293D3505
SSVRARTPARGVPRLAQTTALIVQVMSAFFLFFSSSFIVDSTDMSSSSLNNHTAAFKLDTIERQIENVDSINGHDQNKSSALLASIESADEGE